LRSSIPNKKLLLA